MEFLDPVTIWSIKDAVLAKINLAELMKEYNLKLESKNTGQFTHRTYCPFHTGKSGGTERTPSFYISTQTNSFYCFGCSITGGPIDFVSLVEGMPATKALIKLAKKVGVLSQNGIIDEEQIKIEPILDNRNIEIFLFDISNLLRTHIYNFLNKEEFEKEFRWMEKVAEKADEFLAQIGYEDYEYAKDLYEKIKIAVDKRLKKVNK
jgi:hypothetical protein